MRMRHICTCNINSDMTRRRQTDRQIGRHTERQTYTQTKTDRHMDSIAMTIVSRKITIKLSLSILLSEGEDREVNLHNSIQNTLSIHNPKIEKKSIKNYHTNGEKLLSHF